MVFFGRQKDLSIDPKPHDLRKKENVKWNALEPARAETRNGLYKSIVGPSSLQLATSSSVVEREDALTALQGAMREELVSAGSTLARIMASSEGLSNEQFSRASTQRGNTKQSMGTRSQTKSPVSHSAEKLNDALSRAWVDMQSSSRDSASIKQLLLDAKQVDAASSSALEMAEKTMDEMRRSARSRSSLSSRSRAREMKESGKVVDGVNCKNMGTLAAVDSEATASATYDVSRLTTDTLMTSGGAREKRRIMITNVRSSPNKAKELNDSQRTWDLSGGIHQTGPWKGLRCTLEHKGKPPTSDRYKSSRTRPASAAPVASPSKAQNVSHARSRPQSAASMISRAVTATKGGARESTSASRRDDTMSKTIKHNLRESQQDLCQKVGMSISVGKEEGAADGLSPTTGFDVSVDSVGRMIFSEIEGEEINPQSHHRKRTDLTSRRQMRNGHGLHVQSPPKILGIKTLEDKHRKQKEYADEIAAATRLMRPQTPAMLPNHSALPLNRPSDNNWAYQTIYMPRVAAHWNPGNVSKIIRNIDYEKERPTWGPHANSN